MNPLHGWDVTSDVLLFVDTLLANIGYKERGIAVANQAHCPVLALVVGH